MPTFKILRAITYDIIFCIILWIHSNSDIYSRRFYAVGNWRSNYLIFNGFFLLPLCYYMWGIVVVVTAVTFIFLSALLFQVVFPNRLHLFIDVFFVSLQGSMALNSSFSNVHMTTIISCHHILIQIFNYLQDRWFVTVSLVFL